MTCRLNMICFNEEKLMQLANWISFFKEMGCDDESC